MKLEISENADWTGLYVGMLIWTFDDLFLCFFGQVHRLIVVDDEQRMSGVVSLPDILNYLLLKQFGEFF